MCGINALDAQWCDYILILFYVHLKLSLLLHKTVLVTFLLATTVLTLLFYLKFILSLYRNLIKTSCSCMMNKALYVRREEREDLLRTPWINHLIIFSAHAHRLVRLIGDIQLPRGQERMSKYMLNQMFTHFRQILTIEIHNDTKLRHKSHTISKLQYDK